MKKNIVIIIVITLLSTALFVGCKADVSSVNKQPSNKQTSVDKNVPKEFTEIAKLLKNITGFQMPFFGGYNLNDQQIIVFSDQNNKAILWSGNNGKISVINKTDIPEEKTLSSFADGKYNGIKTTYVKQENSAIIAFILAVHEGYHFYGQEWINQINFTSYIPRGTVYPENIEARYLMNEADSRLRAYIEGENSDGLKEAIYYINKVKEKHQEDLMGNLNTGIAEGTANFIENIYVAVAQNPNLKNNIKEIAKKAYEYNKKNLAESYHSKSSEYYHITSLPLYYFAMQGKTELVDKIMQGKHSLEVLKELDSTKIASENKQLKDKIYTFYSEKNKEAAKYINKYKEQIKSSDYVQIQIPESVFAGSMGFGEFINFKNGEQYQTLNVQTSAEGKLGDGIVNINNHDTTMSDDYKYYVLYVKKDTINIANNTINVKSNTVTINNVKFSKKHSAYILVAN